MRILQINSVCGITSTGRIAADLCKEAQSRGHICKIAYGEVTYHNRTDGLNTYKVGNRINCISHAILTRIFDIQGLCSKFATKKLIEEIEIFQPDLIHLHNLHGYYLNYQLLFQYIKEKRIRVFWTLHDCWAFTGHCVYFDYVGCEKWIEECFKCPQKRNYPSSVLFDNSRKNYGIKRKSFSGIKDMTVIVPSHWMEKRVRKSFLGEYPVEVIYNGVDLATFFPVKSDFRARYHLEDKYVILGVANVWDERKGLNTFVELAQRIPKDIAIVLVGVSPAQKEKLPDNMIGIEHTNSKEELAKIYTMADLFINPSVEETFGLTTIEAMACGTDVIVYKDTACEEIIKLCGGAAIDRTIECLESEILNRREKPTKTDMRERVLQFSNEVFCKKVVELYEK